MENSQTKNEAVKEAQEQSAAKQREQQSYNRIALTQHLNDELQKLGIVSVINQRKIEEARAE